MVKEIDTSTDRLKKIADYLIKRAKRSGDADAAEKGKTKFEELVDRRKQAIDQKKEAEVWTSKVRSGVPEAHGVARAEIQQEVYTKDQLVKAVEHFNKVKNNVPDWIKKQNLTTAVGIEFAAQIAELPSELQHSPAVLYQKTAILYASANWTELTNEEHSELRKLLYESFAEVRRLQQDPVTAAVQFGAGLLEDQDLLYSINPGADIYITAPRVHIDIVDEGIDPEPQPQEVEFVKRNGQKGTRLNRDDPDFKKRHFAWERRKQTELQQRNLDHYLRNVQWELNNDLNKSLEQQLGILEGKYKDLTGKLEEGLRNEKFKRLYPEEQVKTYIERIKAERNRIKSVLDIQQEREQMARVVSQEKMRGNATVEENIIGQLLTKKQFEEWKKRVAGGADNYFTFRYLERNDALTIVSGPDGHMRFVSEKLFDMHGQGREHEKPTLLDTYQYEEFQKFMKWTYGETDGKAYLSVYDFIWNDYSKQDFVYKTLLYKAGDPKDKLLALRSLLGADMDSAAQVEFANLTISMYMQVLDERQMDLTNQVIEAEEHLRSTVPLDAFGMDTIMAARKKDLPPLNYDEYFVELRKLQRAGKLPNDQYKLFNELERKAELVAKGTVITDEDVLVYNEVNNQLNRFRERRDGLEARKEKNEPLTATEEQELIRLREVITLKSKQLEFFELQDKLYKLRELESRKNSGQPFTQEEQTRMDDLDKFIKEKSVKLDYMTSMTTGEQVEGEALSAEELGIRRGYSPLEWEVRRRAKPMVEKTLGRALKTEDEWRLRSAVLAARVVMIGTGHMMTEASVNVIKPMALRGELKSIDFFAGKSIMWAPIMEDVVRIINPDYFEERFGMGSPWGERLRAIRRINYLKTKNYAGDIDIKQTQEYQELGSAKISPEERLSRAYVEFARRETGIEAEYMLSEGWTGGGGALDMSLWRPEGGLLDELQKKCEEKGYPHAWKNMALWLQFAMIGTKTPEDIQARETILLRALDRAPSKFFHLFAGEIVNDIKKKRGIDDLEWRAFMRALTVTETQLWQDWELASRDVVLRHGDFDVLLKPNLIEFGIRPERAYIFREALDDIQDVAIEKRPKLTKNKPGRQYETRINALAAHNFPMTLSYADLDWSVANFFKLGTTVFDRRGRDIVNMAQVRDNLFLLDTDPEMVRPHGEKGVEEWIKKLVETKGAFGSHTDVNTVEAGLLELVRQNLAFNRSRVKDVRNILGWIPGADGLMRKISTMEPEHLPILDRIPLWQNFLKENNLIGKKIKDWPHSVGEAVSLSVRYFGPEAEDWDIHRVDHIIDMIEHKGLFAENPKFYGMLRREFGSTVLSRMLDIPRKYWWVVIFATISVAALESVNEERKSHH